MMPRSEQSERSDDPLGAWQGRSSIAVELNPTYWADGVMHVQGAANEIATPTLFDLDEDAAA